MNTAPSFVITPAKPIIAGVAPAVAPPAIIAIAPVTVPITAATFDITSKSGPIAAASPANTKITFCVAGDMLENLSASFPNPSTTFVTAGSNA